LYLLLTAPIRPDYFIHVNLILASAPPVVLRAGFSAEIGDADGGGAAGVADIALSAIG
jgi:hypothetical protein